MTFLSKMPTPEDLPEKKRERRAKKRDDPDGGDARPSAAEREAPAPPAGSADRVTIECLY